MDPQTRRLLGFTTAAVVIHAVVILIVEPEPPETPVGSEPLLTLTLEKKLHAATPGPEPPPSRREQAEASTTAEAGRTPPRTDSAGPAGTGDPQQTSSPSVHELLSDVPDVAPEAPSPFRGRPEPHPIFESGREIPPATSNDLLDEGVWHRTRSITETRYAALDGRTVWIKRFDNGEMQVCEKPNDSLFDHWDDSLPFACDRPSR